MALPKTNWSVRGPAGAGVQVFQLPKPIIFLLYLASQELIITYVKK